MAEDHECDEDDFDHESCGDERTEPRCTREEILSKMEAIGSGPKPSFFLTWTSVRDQIVHVGTVAKQFEYQLDEDEDTMRGTTEHMDRAIYRRDGALSKNAQGKAEVGRAERGAQVE